MRFFLRRAVMLKFEHWVKLTSLIPRQSSGAINQMTNIITLNLNWLLAQVVSKKIKKTLHIFKCTKQKIRRMSGSKAKKSRLWDGITGMVKESMPSFEIIHVLLKITTRGDKTQVFREDTWGRVHCAEEGVVEMSTLTSSPQDKGTQKEAQQRPKRKASTMRTGKKLLKG